MSEISDEVNVTVDAKTATITRAGYGKPLILTHNATWTELIREYATIAEVTVDWAIGTPENLAATAIFSAKNRPPSLLIGHADPARKPTLQWQIVPTAVDSAVYKMKVGSNLLSFTAGVGTTASLIIAGLKALIDALALPITVSETLVGAHVGGGAGTGAMKIVETTAGAFHSISTVDTKLSLTQVHADPGVATDLALIALERNDWYGLVTLYNSSAYVTAAAAWAQANTKLYVFQTQDSDVLNTVLSGATDIVTAMGSHSYDHVVAIFSKATADFADAAWLGRVLPITPGKETWKFKSLIGVEVGKYTSTQRSNMRAKKCNFYETTKGAPMTEEGYTVSGAWIDLVRYVDSLIDGMASDVFTPLVEEDRVGQNDVGISIFENIIRGHLANDQTAGILDSYTTTVPKFADVTEADREARLLQGVEFTAVYVGAVHKVKIHGNVVQ